MTGGIGVMGRRQATPRWADDTVWRNVGGGVVGAGGGFPHPEVNQEAEIVGGAGQVNKYVTIRDRV